MRSSQAQITIQRERSSSSDRERTMQSQVLEQILKNVQEIKSSGGNNGTAA